MLSCTIGYSFFADHAASLRRHGFHAYSQLGTCRGGGLLMDSNYWSAPGGRQLFVGRQFHAIAFLLRVPCCLAEDVFCGAATGSMLTIGLEHVAEGG